MTSLKQNQDGGNSDENQSTQNQYGFENAKFIEEKSQKTNEVKRYQKGKFLGKGGFAKCYEFTIVDTKQQVAAKVIPKSSLTKSRAKQKLMSEIKIHRSLNNTNIVGFQHFFEDYENTMNELLRRRKRLTELEVQCYLVQILSSIKYLHKHRVIHRDLKLGNLFLSDKMEIKLGDFGLATKLEYDGEKKRTICGTPNYIAPEILEGKRGHSYEVDVWSTGVIMYTLLIGKPPFETNDVKTTYRRIKMNAYSFPEHVIISPQAKDLITKILQTDPSKRPTVDEIMAHDFFNCAGGGSIPKLLPVSTLACPPSVSYLKQFQPQNPNKDKDTTSSGKVSPGHRLESTAPNPYKAQLKERKDFINTDRAFSSGTAVQQQQQSGPNFDINNINNNNILNNQQNINNHELLDPQQKLKTTTNIMQPSSSSLAYNSNINLKTQENSTKGSLEKFNYVKSQVNQQSQQQLPTTVSSQLQGQDNLNQLTQLQKQPQQEVWVQKWVDYSCKYGLGYLLNTGASGAFFNDNSKIILDPAGEKLDYIERKGSDKEDFITKFTLKNYPKEIQKKLTLLQHFKSYLEGDTKKDIEPLQKQIDIQPSNSTALLNHNSNDVHNINQTSNIYVKKWLRTKHAILFRLSNKVVQVIFQDQTQIMLSSELKIVTYVNKKQEKLTFPLATALESSNQEMSKRLKYTKDILTHMLGNGQAGEKDKDKEKDKEKEKEKDKLKSSKNQIQNNNLNFNSDLRQNYQQSQQTLNHQQTNSNSVNKFAPSVDCQFKYVSIPSQIPSINPNNENNLFGSVTKNTQITNENEIALSNNKVGVSSSNQFGQQLQTCSRLNNNKNATSMGGSYFNISKKEFAIGTGSSIENLQMMKSQSQIGRLSLMNQQYPSLNSNIVPPTNNFMTNSQKQTEK